MKSGLGTSKSDSDKKKKFVPNFNVQRKENAGKSVITINKDNNSKPSGWNKQQQQQQNSKTQQPRGNRNFIQSSGLFSEGVGSEQDGKKKTKPPQLHDGPMELSPGPLLVVDAPEITCFQYKI